MNNSNPFVPQGSLLEQKNKKRARVKVAVFTIFALNILVISPLLIQGCSKKDSDTTSTTGDTSTTTAATPTAPADTGPAPLPPVGSNTTAVTSNTVPPPVVAPPPPVTPPPPPAPTTQEYTAIKGDTFYSIAKKFNVRMKDVESANPNIVPAKLKVGDKVQIPAASSSTSTGAGAPGTDSGDLYVVKAGDSLTKIAHSHGITVKALKAANDSITKTDRIKAGQKLHIPAKAAPADTTPTTTTAVPTPAPPPVATGAPGGH